VNNLGPLNRRTLRDVSPLLFLVFASSFATAHQTSVDAPSSKKSCRLHVIAFDSDHHPLADVRVELRRNGNLFASADTDGTGNATLSQLSAGEAAVTASKPGFLTAQPSDITLTEASLANIELTMVRQPAHKEKVEVTAVQDSVAPSAGTQSLPPETAKELPSRPATVTDALPLIPGVMRSPQGSLEISGRDEPHSGLIVNSADVTDPATGQFGQTVPIDRVEVLNVLQSPFLAEYGQFTAGLVAVETKRGGEKWKAELNDPLPDFRIRSWRMHGIRDATPRLNFEGPLMKGKLYFSEGFDYELKNVSVITLPFPENQKKTEGFNSFSQLDYIASATHLMTATVHFASERLNAPNMDFFNPLGTTPDARQQNITVTLADKRTIHHADLLENTISFTDFTTATWPLGEKGLTLTPIGNTGNYFSQQNREAARGSWLSTYSLHPLSALGSHNLKAGSYVGKSREYAHVSDRPMNILNANGGVLETIRFTGGSAIHQSDTEFAFFVQDHWSVTRNLSVDLGMRTESQEVTEALRVAPRLGVAWKPLSKWGTTVRAGVGLFYDRVPLNVFGFANNPERIITSYDGSGQILSGPTFYSNVLGQVDARTPFVFHENQVGDFSPRSTTWSAEIEQPITSILKVRASYMVNQSSGNVLLNPVPPAVGSANGLMILTGNGDSRYHQLALTARLRLQGEKQQMFFSYVGSGARGDLNGFSNFLGTYPVPLVLSNQYGNLPSNLPNRFLAWGLLHFPWKFQLAPIVEYRSGFPYAVTDAYQVYVGQPYSSHYPTFFSLDARISKDFQVNPKYSVRFSVSGFNLTNHWNPDSVYSNTGAQEYGVFFGQHKRRFQADFEVIF
jgi:Carboxypeptidase regulatory-like domain